MTEKSFADLDEDFIEMIRAMIGETGYQMDDGSTAIRIKNLIDQKLDQIIINAHYYAQRDSPGQSDLLQLGNLQKSLHSLNISFNRPEYILKTKAPDPSAQRYKPKRESARQKKDME